MRSSVRLLNIIIVFALIYTKPGIAQECIAVVTAGGGQGFWGNVINGANQAGKELNIKIYSRGAIDETNETGQRHIIKSAIQQGCTGLVLAPNSNDQTTLVSQLKKYGIPTVFIDRDIGGDRISVIKTKNFLAGQQAAIEMSRALNGKGKVALLRMDKKVLSTTSREQGFLSVANTVGLEIVADHYIGTRIGEARNNAYQILKELPNINGVFTPNESTSIAVVKAFEQLSSPGKIIHIGFDAPDIMIEALKSGAIYGFIVQNPFQMGYLGVHTVHDAMHGKGVKPKVNTAALFISKDNINNSEIRKVLGLEIQQSQNDARDKR